MSVPILPLAELSVGAAAGVAVLSGLVSGFVSPLLLSRLNESRQLRLDRSAKETLRKMLGEKDARSLERLARATGITEEECKRLLRELDPDGKGVRLKGGVEGWKLPPRDGGVR